MNSKKYSCYSTCPNGTHDFYNNNTCILICENNFDYDRQDCLEKVPIGYYLNDSILKTIDKCYNKCESCSSKSIDKGLCISCNNNISY